MHFYEWICIIFAFSNVGKYFLVYSAVYWFSACILTVTSMYSVMLLLKKYCHCQCHCRFLPLTKYKKLFAYQSIMHGRFCMMKPYDKFIYDFEFGSVIYLLYRFVSTTDLTKKNWYVQIDNEGKICMILLQVILTCLFVGHQKL